MIGQTISHYKILEKLGEGGMGVVYKAHDTELDRYVAVKALPEQLIEHNIEQQRFLQEAKAASALNHPNVCTIHDFLKDDNKRYIVMEYVDGKTLTEVLHSDTMNQTVAIDYAIQIVGALEEAHSKGIIHRDVKPDNIMVNKKNQIKVMDFGLAKLKGSLKITKTASTAGTLAYMSPEQIQEGTVDARSDIFSFGIVLYEMLTGGNRPFRGEHDAAMVYSIVNEEPEPIQKYRPELSSEWLHIINRALEKQPGERYQSVSDMLIDLRRLKKASSRDVYLITGRIDHDQYSQKNLWQNIKSNKLLLLITMIVSMAVIIALVIYLFNKQPSKPTLAVHKQITFSGNVKLPSISPDGKSIAYVEGSDQGVKVFVKDLGSEQPIEIFKSSNVWDVRWLPDGLQLSVVGGQELFLVPRFGGTYRNLGPAGYVSWSPDGSRYAIAAVTFKRILIKEKNLEKSTWISIKGSYLWMFDVDWSPKGQMLIVYTVQESIYTVSTISIDGTNQNAVVTDTKEISSPRWSSNGDAIYYLRFNGQTKDLMKVSIDQSSGKANNAPYIIQSGIESGSTISISRDDINLLYTRENSYINLWLIRYEGKDTARIISRKQITKGTSNIHNVAISPDGKKIAFGMGKQSQSNIYIMNIENESQRQLTFLSSLNTSPAWSPDGSEIAFGSTEGGVPRVWKVNSEGGIPRSFAKSLIASDGLYLIWSPGKEILYQQPGNRNFHFLNPITEEERSLINNDSLGWIYNPIYSPDGKNIAAYWNRSQKWGEWIFSISDGLQRRLNSDPFPLRATWSNDGKNIFFTKQYEGDTLYVQPVDGGERRKYITFPATDGSTMQVEAMDPAHKIIICSVSTKTSDAWLMENFDPEVK